MIQEKMQFVTESAEETEKVGFSLADSLLSAGARRAFVALFGELGAGKTAFCRGFAARVAPAAAVRSPTYTIVNEYRGGAVPVFHFDMYRIADEDELYATGYWDFLAQEGFCLCEWSENIPYALPDCSIKVMIAKIPDDAGKRLITVEPAPSNPKN